MTNAIHCSRYFLWMIMLLPFGINAGRLNKIVIPSEIVLFALGGRIASSETPYFAANERRPNDAQFLYKRIQPKTAYLSIGSDRGYITGAIADVDRLILVDRDKGVTLFNYINTLLLREARSASDYLHLRQNTDDWAKRLCKHIARDTFKSSLGRRNGPKFKQFMNSIVVFWNKIHEIFKGYFDIFYAPVGMSVCESYPYEQDMTAYTYTRWWAYLCSKDEGAPFEGASLFESEELFQRAKKLAQTVIIKNLNIADNGKVRELVHELAENEIYVGAVDTSNIFQLRKICRLVSEADVYDASFTQKDIYLNEIARESFSFLVELKPVLAPEALLITTEISKGALGEVMTRGGSVVEPPDKLPLWSWKYRGGYIKDIFEGDCVEVVKVESDNSKMKLREIY